MIFVHKKSATPITHWDALRHGGENNLEDAGVKGKYLVLWNVDIIVREGAWHYIFEFDVRDTLEISALAQLAGKQSRYPDDMNWKQWLGGDAQVITADVREAILTMPEGEAHTDAVITDVREVPNAFPIPGRGPHNAFQVELPERFLLSLQ
jgi:hypothetical protein